MNQKGKGLIIFKVMDFGQFGSYKMNVNLQLDNTNFQFPNFSLKDKVVLNKEEIDSNSLNESLPKLGEEWEADND